MSCFKWFFSPSGLVVGDWQCARPSCGRFFEGPDETYDMGGSQVFLKRHGGLYSITEYGGSRY